ncbi:hypothetical protein [Aquimarina sp. MMG016]|uniref:hypothetical protein n=1 Tax=Aquimarina sp. MMG016 TaxID=2822690 RepID=UPI001B3A3552|nr:hypothetical protein [Aquimarina sp. MMG016]MBQ4821799.1 hypothetical protein [Aquimarina sp. MMG016]
MKKVILCLTASVFLTILSCGDDDSAIGLTPVNIDPSEEVFLDPTEISKNLIIDGGSRITGNAPSSNGSLSFTINKEEQSAFQKNGFSILLNAPTNYAGSYIQIKNEDGTLAPDYWDVPVGVKSSKSNHKKRKVSNKNNDGDIEIDVDFEDSVTAGRFCYVICIYDEEGNISPAEEICVEVEAWGGNPNLIGTWNYTKQVANGITTPVGEINFCESPGFINCNNQETLIVPEDKGWCYASTEIKLELNADGTYVINDFQFQKQSFIFDQSISTCTIVNETVNDEFGSKETSKGYWAYNEEKEEIILIEFENTTFYFDDNFEDSYTEEFGELHQMSGFSLLNGSSLVISGLDYDFTNVTEYHFTK